MISTEILTRLAAELTLHPDPISDTIRLLDEGNTIPFVARYRKEVTHGMDEVQLRQLVERLAYHRNLADRKATVLRTIGEQGKLTPDLAAEIIAVETLQDLEDLYLPYRPKRRTRATVARERGLEPLSRLILQQTTSIGSLEETARPYLSAEVPTPEIAWAGARDVVAEQISDHANVRAAIRDLYGRGGYLRVTLADAEADSRRTYQVYYDFGSHVRHLRPHQVLAINRGEKDRVLKVHLQEPVDQAIACIQSMFPPNRSSPLKGDLLAAVDDAYHRLIRPSIEREVRRNLTITAEDHAISVFATNLRALLLVPPLRGRTILALDPGYRTGCKVAVISTTGAVLDAGTIHPHEPRKEWERSKATLHRLIEQHQVNLIAIGNGTAGRETEQLASEIIRELDGVQYIVVSEAGASVYSAMPLARRELPDLDVSLRGAVSIGRRILDPLAELVKIEPKSIGVGLYQHDVDQKKLSEALDTVVQSVVNHVGVNLNTASPSLLQYVAGLGPRTADAIVAYRDQHGPFRLRGQVLQVMGVGPRAFQQAAGFLRIPDGDVPLDNTGVHPESYPVVERLLEIMRETGRTWAEQITWENLATVILRFRQRFDDLSELAAWLDVGEMTLADILQELAKPGRDPRDELDGPLLRSGVMSMDDLRPGMQLKGTVRNVVDFGAFVDIGVKEDGLLHISQMSGQRVRDRYSVVSVGDVIDVTVISVDVERRRISLSLRR